MVLFAAAGRRRGRHYRRDSRAGAREHALRAARAARCADAAPDERLRCSPSPGRSSKPRSIAWRGDRRGRGSAMPSSTMKPGRSPSWAAQSATARPTSAGRFRSPTSAAQSTTICGPAGRYGSTTSPRTPALPIPRSASFTMRAASPRLSSCRSSAGNASAPYSSPTTTGRGAGASITRSCCARRRGLAGDQRARAETELRHSEERYRRIFEQASDLIVTATLDQ